MDVQQKLDRIVAAVDGARSMPMSASCVVNRAELLAMLGEVREALPGSLAQAQELLGGREQMVAEAQEEAQRIIESAQSERGSLVSGTEIARSAQEEADRILAKARQEAEEVRAEADDYVDSKLANFEVVLSKTIGSVERGREKLLGAGPGAEEWNAEYAEDAPERTTDPRELRERADAYVDGRLGSVAAVLSKTLEAVGRGRQKLLGQQPSDELAEHLNGPEDAPVHTSDADFLAGLATTPYAPQPQETYAPQPQDAYVPQPQEFQAPPEPVQPQPDPQFAPAPMPEQMPGQVPQQPVYEPMAAGVDPYGQQLPQQPQDVYYAQDPYLYQQQAAYYEPAQQDPYFAQQPPPQDYGQYQQPHPQQMQPQPQLDETSLFDTSMIDLDEVRRYEQGYGPSR